MARRLVIIGFSNVATKSGFTMPTIARLRAASPDLEVVRVGLGALQPQVIPPYLREAAARLGPVSHVLFEVNSSAFALHPLAGAESGRELLLDMLLAARDIGADPAFLLHHRRWTAPVRHDFNAQTRQLCRDLDIPLIDLAEAWVAEVGAERIAGLLRDDVHTTAEGGEAMAERLAPFLSRCLERRGWFAARRIPRPVWRRGMLDIAGLLPDRPTERHDCMDLPQWYARLEDSAAVLRFRRDIHAQALVHLFHPAGGRVDLRIEPGDLQMQVATVDPFSYAVRIGTVALDFYRGLRLRSVAIAPPADAPEIRLVKGERERPLRTYVGPMLTLDPAAGP
jgi:hypothetical protein